jgi:fructokinase
VLDAARRAREAKLLVSLDPNIRTEIVGDPVSTRARFLELARHSHIVKLSDEDSMYLFPDASDHAIPEILALGPELVVVTKREAGAILATSAVRATVPAQATTVVDTIGAGDSFMSTLVAELLQVRSVGDPARTLSELSADALTRIGDRCAKASAITVSRSGANPPTLDELRSYQGSPLVEGAR